AKGARTTRPGGCRGGHATAGWSTSGPTRHRSDPGTSCTRSSPTPRRTTWSPTPACCPTAAPEPATPTKPGVRPAPRGPCWACPLWGRPRGDPRRLAAALGHPEELLPGRQGLLRLGDALGIAGSLGPLQPR